MDDTDSPLDADTIGTRLIPLRLLVGAMVAGQVVLALGATWLLASGVGAGPEPLPWLFIALAVVGVGELAAWPVVKSAGMRRLRKQGPPTVAAALATFIRLRVVAAAMAEGFGLLGIMAYLMSGSQLALAAPALSIFVLLRVQPEPATFGEFARAAGVASANLPPAR